MAVPTPGRNAGAEVPRDREGLPHAGAPVRSDQVVNMGAQAPWVQETISTSKFYLELYEGVEFYSFPTVWNSTAVLLKAITS